MARKERSINELIAELITNVLMIMLASFTLGLLIGYYVLK